MTTMMLEITCRDPVVSRDGRPFGVNQGNRMRGLDWLLPSVVAGALRTTLGKVANRDFQAIADELLGVEVAGPFPVAEGRLYLPAPEDCVVHPERGPLRAQPRPLDTGGCDLPVSGLQPVGVPEDFKPDKAPDWWPEERVAAWLALADSDIPFDRTFLLAPEKVERTHVRLNPDTGAAEEGALFTTSALALSDLPRYGARARENHSSCFAPIRLAVRVRAQGWCAETAAKLDTLYALGGERRLVHWRATDNGAWSSPQAIRTKLAAAERVRMMLATPALFGEGWKPRWLNGELIGKPPGANVTLQLIGVSIRRWRAVSGWSLLNQPPDYPGPKPVRRMVPAGGVYFFEVRDGNAAELGERWFESVSDDEQDRRDGFGLALWGIW